MAQLAFPEGRKRLLRLMLLTAWVAWAAPAFAESKADRLPKDKNALFQLLRDRDAQFDNLLMEIEKSWHERVDPEAVLAERRFHELKDGLSPAPTTYQELPKPYTQPHRVRYQMIIRGQEVTFNGDGELEAIQHPEFSMLAAKHSRYTTANGRYRAYDDAGSQPTIHEIAGHSRGSLIELFRLSAECSLGFGLARCLDSVESLEIKNGEVIGRAPIRLGDSDQSVCEFVLDDDLILRKATFLVDGGPARMEVKSSGTRTLGGLPPIAASGSFRRIFFTTPPAPAVPVEIVGEDDAFQVLSIQSGLTDAQYAELVTIPEEPGTLVISSGATKTIGKDQEPVVGSNLSKTRLAFLVATIFVTMLLAFSRIRMRLSAGKN